MGIKFTIQHQSDFQDAFLTNKTLKINVPIMITKSNIAGTIGFAKKRMIIAKK